MSAARAEARAPAFRRAGIRTQVAAVLVVLALAGLAAYTLFSPPTKAPVPSAAPSPAPKAPQVRQEERQREGGERGD